LNTYKETITSRGKEAERVSNQFKLRRDGPTGWLLTEQATGLDIGSVQYRHSNDGHHYITYILVDGRRQEIGEALPQLAQAAQFLISSYQKMDRR
jgi:hypothetical protein